MRIILDTNKGRIIVPKSFFTELGKMNKILEEGGSTKKWTPEEYVKEQLKNPPAGYEEAYEALKEYYSAYLELTNMATNPSGSLQSYSSNFNEADSNALNCYNAMRLYIGD